MNWALELWRLYYWAFWPFAPNTMDNTGMIGDNVIKIERFLCRFCGTRDAKKIYVARDTTNPWSATICENCIEDSFEAVKKLRKQRDAPNPTGAA